MDLLLSNKCLWQPKDRLGLWKCQPGYGKWSILTLQLSSMYFPHCLPVHISKCKKVSQYGVQWNITSTLKKVDCSKCWYRALAPFKSPSLCSFKASWYSWKHADSCQLIIYRNKGVLEFSLCYWTGRDSWFIQGSGQMLSLLHTCASLVVFLEDVDITAALLLLSRFNGVSNILLYVMSTISSKAHHI